MYAKSQIYLVTGAAGFIGSYVCRALLQLPETQSVIGIDNLNSYYSPRIKKNRIHQLNKFNRFAFYRHTVFNRGMLQKIVSSRKPTVLIHTAAEVGVRNGETHPLQYFRTNVLGTMTVLESCAQSVRHVVVISSSSVYGNSKNLPFKENASIDISTPLSTYGASKAAMEIAVNSFHNHSGIPVTIIRPFSVYGPDGRPDMLPMKLLIAAKSNAPVTIFAPNLYVRDWTYIDDCVRALCGTLVKPRGLQVINIGGGNPLRLDKTITISQEIIRQYGYSLRYETKPANPSEILVSRANTAKMKTLIHPYMLTGFREGFKKTADFFFSHPELYDV